MLTQKICEPNDLGMQGMCGHKQIGIWEVSKITVVDSNDIKPAVTIVALCWDRYSYHRCVECRMRALPNAEGKYGCAKHPAAKTQEIYCLRILLRQDDLNMWVTAFADVAELITGVSVEECHAFDDAGRKRILWGVRGMKCNMTLGKTVGEMYTNYTVQSVEFAGYLQHALSLHSRSGPRLQNV